MISKQQQADHWKNKDLKIIESYWNSPKASLRSIWFCEQLKQFKFESIFEVGFFSGRNLKYILEAFVDSKVGGIEINPKAVKYAKEKLHNTNLLELDLHNLDSITDRYDIIFTSGVLIHIPPKDLKSVIEKMIKKSNKYLMHIEELGPSELIACPEKRLMPKYKVSDQWQWNCDLISIYKDLGFISQTIELPDEIRTNGAKQMVIVKV